MRDREGLLTAIGMKIVRSKPTVIAELFYAVTANSLVKGAKSTGRRGAARVEAFLAGRELSDLKRVEKSFNAFSERFFAGGASHH